MNDTCAYCEKENLSEVYFEMTCQKCVNRMFRIVTETSENNGESNSQLLQDLKDSLIPKISQDRTSHQ